MALGQGAEQTSALGGQPQPDGALIVRIAHPLQHAELLSPVDQLDGRVVPDEQVVGDVVDGRAGRVGVTPHGQQQLVLARGQPVRGRLLGAPMLELPQPRPNGEQPRVTVVADGLGHFPGDPLCAPVRPMTIICRTTIQIREVVRS